MFAIKGVFMAKKAYQIRNWSSYNKSLAQRGSLTFWFSEDLLARWAAREAMTHGNQQYPDLIILSSLTIRQLFRLPLRATQGMIQSLLLLMNTQMKAPDYTTLCRRSKTLKIDLSIKPTSAMSWWIQQGFAFSEKESGKFASMDSPNGNCGESFI